MRHIRDLFAETWRAPGIAKQGNLLWIFQCLVYCEFKIDRSPFGFSYLLHYPRMHNHFLPVSSGECELDTLIECYWSEVWGRAIVCGKWNLIFVCVCWMKALSFDVLKYYIWIRIMIKETLLGWFSLNVVEGFSIGRGRRHTYRPWNWAACQRCTPTFIYSFWHQWH